MEHPTGYVCKECGAVAHVAPDGTIRRDCAHTGTVLMLMDVTLSGEGRAGEENPLVLWFQRIGQSIMRRLA